MTDFGPLFAHRQGFLDLQTYNLKVESNHHDEYEAKWSMQTPGDQAAKLTKSTIRLFCSGRAMAFKVSVRVDARRRGMTTVLLRKTLVNVYAVNVAGFVARSALTIIPAGHVDA